VCNKLVTREFHIRKDGKEEKREEKRAVSRRRKNPGFRPSGGPPTPLRVDSKVVFEERETNATRGRSLTDAAGGRNPFSPRTRSMADHQSIKAIY